MEEPFLKSSVQVLLIKIVPFIKSYKEVVDCFIQSSQTEYLWILTSLCDYSQFDFDYIPEQFERTQVHTWAVKGQKEGDTFLIHKSFTEQKIKFLRDYKDVNYHNTDYEYDFNYDVKLPDGLQTGDLLKAYFWLPDTPDTIFVAF